MAELVDATDSKSVELRFMSVRVGLGVPSIKKQKFLVKKIKDHHIFLRFCSINITEMSNFYTKVLEM